jgi:hypothetical protein
MNNTFIPVSPKAMRAAATWITAAILSLCALTAHAEKTISYYQENVGERIDRVLSCRDGAEDPMSLGCRNAQVAHEMDVQLASRFQRKVMTTNWMDESNSNKKEVRVHMALQFVGSSVASQSCVSLTGGVEPAAPVSKAILKAAVDEKFLQGLPGQPGKFRFTPRGEEFLRALMSAAKSGMFCPVAIQYGSDIKILDYRDITAQYKGRKSPTGATIKTVAVAKVALDLTNTSASVWFTKKIYTTVLPMTGQVVGEYVILEFAGRPGISAAGRFNSVSESATSKFNADEFLSRYK